MQPALVRESCEDGVDVVLLSGDISDAHAAQILQLFVGYRRHDMLVLDLVAVASLSTHVVAALVIGQSYLDRAGCKLVLRSVSAAVFAAFEITHTEAVFTFTDQR